jgi:transcription initiation factor TFIID TATA-box-binding protein
VCVQYTRILQKLGYQCTFLDFSIQNMVASCSVDFPIRLEGLAAHFDMYVHYEPEVFPGLVFRMVQPKVVLLIFVTGKLVITGAKNIKDIYTAFTDIYGVLQDHRKGDARRLVRAPPATPGTALGAPEVRIRTAFLLLKGK